MIGSTRFICTSSCRIIHYYLRRPPDLDPLFLRGAKVEAGVVGAAPNAGARTRRNEGEYQVDVNINIRYEHHTLLPAAG